MRKEIIADNRISVTMISNAMNHHQFSFCDSMYEIPDISFRFIATKPIAEERLKTGFRDLNSSRDYIIRSYESDEANREAKKLADESDFVIYGSAPFYFIKRRIQQKKWTFLYSERLFKEVRGGDLFNLKTIVACTLRYCFASHEKLRLLCSSAYASSDYRFFRFPESQTYKWGYFPPVSKKLIEYIQSEKVSNSIIWTGRMIHWKHPELAIELAKRLKANGTPFSMKLIGDGPMAEDLKRMTAEAKLNDSVEFLGVLSAKDTRTEMEQSQIMITTSDHNEGWGAVVNEGLSAGCAVVASHLMGSVPYLIKDGVNGLIFESGNLDDLYNKVSTLIKDHSLAEKLGKAAYDTIVQHWNGNIAAIRLAEVFRRYIHNENDFAFESGICSHAERLSNHWIKE